MVVESDFWAIKILSLECPYRTMRGNKVQCNRTLLECNKIDCDVKENETNKPVH